MVVNERVIRCVDVMVRGEVSGGRGDGGDGGHLQGRWGLWLRKRGRVVRCTTGSAAGTCH